MDLQPGQLKLDQLETLYYSDEPIRLSDSCWPLVDASRGAVNDLIDRDETIYGLNTGFGLLANRRISTDDLAQLQLNLVRSHAAGTGKPLSNQISRLVMVLKAASLARGYSGVRREIIELLVNCINLNLNPWIPEKGSVGASGDLAPLAHMSMAMIGEGKFLANESTVDARLALNREGLKPIVLAAKEGLALLNGTQVSTALSLAALFSVKRTFRAAIVAGALSVDAAKGSDTPFDHRIHAIRNHQEQISCAAAYRKLLSGSDIRDSHRDCNRVQDPYSLRCQPQVMGACLNVIKNAEDTILKESNAVSDNPLVFADETEILSGGNFHAEPVAFAADQIAIALSEISALAERRIALLIDKHLSELPPFLIGDGGLNSGFMIPQVTAAALASENKQLATPCSTDSMPTSANQEDHVSMATYAARRLLTMAENANSIIAIELLAACQGIDFRLPLKTSPLLTVAYQLVRRQASFYDCDRPFADEILKIRENVVDSNALDQVLVSTELF